MILKKSFIFDVNPGGRPLRIRVSKNDSSVSFTFFLFSGIGVLDIPANTTAVFQGQVGSTTASFAFVNGVPAVVVNLTKELTHKTGLIPFEIVLTSETYTLITATIFLEVRRC